MNSATMDGILSERGREKFAWNGFLYVFDRYSTDGVSTYFVLTSAFSFCAKVTRLNILTNTYFLHSSRNFGDVNVVASARLVFM